MRLTNLLFIVYVPLLCSCMQKTEKPADIVADDFDFAGKQLNYAFTEIDSAKAALSVEDQEKGLFTPCNLLADGSLKLVASKDWRSGFFGGELWYMYEYTKDDFWKKKAEEFTAPVEQEKTNGKTHDMGFKVYCSFGNGYRLTGNEQYKDIMLESARTLITRFHKSVGCIRSWDHHQDVWQYPVIIDNMMNLELLFWAFKESKDSVFYDVAVSHAKTTMKNHFREDYSSYHVIDYDSISGEVLHKNTHQGYADESSWSRGQAWGIYGFTMCYRETALPEFLEQARHIADYIMNHPSIPEDAVPYWDYMAPNQPNEARDASAAAVTASGMYELSTYLGKEGAKYKEYADRIIQSLSSSSYRSPVNENKGFLLLHSTGSAPSNSDVDVPLVYADYYFLEALLRKHRLDNGEPVIAE